MKQKFFKKKKNVSKNKSNQGKQKIKFFTIWG